MSALSRQGADVRINEIDLSTTLVQNSNAVGALVVVSNKGPVAAPQFYASWDDFRNDFGPPDASVSFDHFAAYDYFREGNALWALRAVNTNALYGMLIVGAETLSNGYIALVDDVTVADPVLYDPELSFPDPQKTMMGFYPRQGPGEFSENFSLEIKSENLTRPNAGTATVIASGGTMVAGSYSYMVAAVNKYGKVLRSSIAMTATIASGTTNSIKITWGASAGATGYWVYGRVAGAEGFMIYVGAGTLTWTDTGAITPSTTVLPFTSYASIPADNWVDDFTVRIYDSTVNPNFPVESFDCTISSVIDENGQSKEFSQKINAFSQYLKVISYVALNTTPAPVRPLTKTAFPAGSAGTTPTTNQVNARWAVFADKERYTIDVMINAGRTSTAVMGQMIDVAEGRQDCVAFLDTPSTEQTAQKAVDFRNVTLNRSSSYAALFCPDLLESNVDTGQLIYIPPSGMMAGLMARVTRAYQPWFSMAGLNRGLVGALDVRNQYIDGEMTLMANAQVNYMRKFLGRGIPLWEQFTLQSKASALQFLNVRVLCNIIKRSMYAYLLYSLQEPGDDILQRQIKYALEEYLRYVKGARGIKDFGVTCSAVNNPPIFANSATLNVSVYIVPTLAIRQINLTLLVGKEGLTISEQDVAALTT